MFNSKKPSKSVRWAATYGSNRRQENPPNLPTSKVPSFGDTLSWICCTLDEGELAGYGGIKKPKKTVSVTWLIGELEALQSNVSWDFKFQDDDSLLLNIHGRQFQLLCPRSLMEFVSPVGPSHGGEEGRMLTLSPEPVVENEAISFVFPGDSYLTSVNFTVELILVVKDGVTGNAKKNPTNWTIRAQLVIPPPDVAYRQANWIEGTRQEVILNDRPYETSGIRTIKNVYKEVTHREIMSFRGYHMLSDNEDGPSSI